MTFSARVAGMNVSTGVRARAPFFTCGTAGEVTFWKAHQRRCCEGKVFCGTSSANTAHARQQTTARFLTGKYMMRILPPDAESHPKDITFKGLEKPALAT